MQLYSSGWRDMSCGDRVNALCQINGTFKQITNATKTMAEHRVICESKGGKLPVIDSPKVEAEIVGK